ncbi:hypothetical protein DH2020_044751 [Rehmannia glutinosa]|uniref:Response regulatory domain-containing protein n=1 Tax=Rehmannia glutinosa TaxID=99300 RepID=A0ABR0UGB9_REHGL
MGMAAADSQFHVLAVDDSLIDRKLMGKKVNLICGIFLKFCFWLVAVSTVDSGSKALEFLGWHEDDRTKSNETSVSPKNHQEVEVNLVITDYCMPGMTGYDLLKKMKESSSLRNIPVVIMSSENVPSRITRRGRGIFLKPMKLSDVNKLRPHMMKTKCNDDNIIEEPEKQEKQESNKEDTTTQETDDVQLQTPQSLQEQLNGNNNNNNNKRKPIDGGLPPDRTRPRYNGLTVMSN